MISFMPTPQEADERARINEAAKLEAELAGYTLAHRCVGSDAQEARLWLASHDAIQTEPKKTWCAELLDHDVVLHRHFGETTDFYLGMCRAIERFRRADGTSGTSGTTKK